MLFLEKKLKWGYIRFFALVLSLLLLSTYSSAFERPQHKLYFHVDTSNEKLSGETGFGISYDAVDKKGNAFAFEHHSFPSSKISYLGYRYHTNGGFNFGLGYAQESNNKASSLLFSPFETTLGITLGYAHVFDSGFSLGVSSIFLLPTAEDIFSTVDLFGSSDPVASHYHLGLVLGYTWR